MILVVSVTDDLHANVILGKLAERGYKASHLIASDQIATSQSISMNITNQGNDGFLVEGGRRISLREAKVLWLRRPRAVQLLDESAHTAKSLELINNDCRVGLNGLITSAFHGKWISAPAACAAGFGQGVSSFLRQNWADFVSCHLGQSEPCRSYRIL
jgi:hypothetical protein